jgi:hypothetical protein
MFTRGSLRFTPGYYLAAPYWAAKEKLRRSVKKVVRGERLVFDEPEPRVGYSIGRSPKGAKDFLPVFSFAPDGTATCDIIL